MHHYADDLSVIDFNFSYSDPIFNPYAYGRSYLTSSSTSLFDVEDDYDLLGDGRTNPDKKKPVVQNPSPPKHRHDGTSPLPLGMDWSLPPRKWDGRNSVWPNDPHGGWSYCVTVPSWVVQPESKGSDSVVVIALRDVIPPPLRREFSDVYMATELMDTDLHHIIRSNQNLSEEHCQYFLYQILRGLKYIHSANIIHRDLKPSNLLLNANCDLKICDFGLARTTMENDFMTEYVVTRWYRAPELLLNSSDYTSAIDVWSVGCIFMELMNKKPLFPGKDHVHQMRLLTELLGTPTEVDIGLVKNEDARRYIRQLPQYTRQPLARVFPHVHPLAIDLIDRMLTIDPTRRITVEEALAHPYLAKLHDTSDEPVCPEAFNFDFEQNPLDEEHIKDMIYEEALAFNPVYA